MPWIKLDDQWMDHPKIIKAGRDARDVWLASLSWCAQYLTDGYFAPEIMPLFCMKAGVDVANCQTFARALLDVCLWEFEDGMYHIHDYTDYNPTKEQAEATKRARTEAGRVGGISKASKTLANANQNASKNLAKVCPVPVPVPVPNEKDSLGEKVQEMLDTWKALFPNKPQPKPKTYRAKIETRLKDPDFVEGWRKALETAANSPTLQNESWFDFGYLVTNDKNYLNLINRWMEWKDRERYGLNGGAPKPSAPPVKMRKLIDARGNTIEVPA